MAARTDSPNRAKVNVARRSKAAAQAGEAREAVLPFQLTSARIVFIISALSILAYANSLSGEFVFDDTEQIVENQNIRSWENLGTAFSTSVWAFREKPEALNLP